MTIASSVLNLLAFPQRWDGAALTVRFLCVPRSSPMEPLAPGRASFADANLRFEARLIGSLDHLPRAAANVSVGPLALDEPPAQKAALFAEITNHITIVPAIALAAGPLPRFRKPVTPSYRALVGHRRLSPLLVDEHAYECALHEAHAAQAEVPPPLDATLDWGGVIAFALRQPKLAAALGLVGQVLVVPPDPDFYARGGWLSVGLSADGDLADVNGLVGSFAGRIPPLAAGKARDIYATVLFPIDDAGPADEAYHDAERYDRGFARLVHAAPGGSDGDGIRLAWDDEHIAESYARQVAGATGRPMGTAGYRVDVRDTGGGGLWHPLQSVASIGELKLGPLTIGVYSGEQVVEVVPVQPSPAAPGDFWMPAYFCTWRGASLVLTDSDLTRLHQRAGFDPQFAALRLDREQTFKPVGDKDVRLLYGRSYQFRVRLADISRGGPGVAAETPADPDGQAHHSAEVLFRRQRPPGAVTVLDRPGGGHPRLRVAKPRLRHPELLFTGAHSFADLEAGLDADAAAGRQQEPGLPDPDVLLLAVRLEARALQGDRTAWLALYETVRDFPGTELTLELDAQDLATLAELPEAQPNIGPLALPTARDLRLVLTALGRTDANYFASEAARHGESVIVELRAAAKAESALFPTPELASFFFRAGAFEAGQPRPSARLAQASGLDLRELTLAGRPGHRTVFGCTAALRHLLSPERSSLTFSAETDLTQKWINVITFDLARDWTWDALAEDGFVVRRTLSRPGAPGVVEIADTLSLPRALTAAELAGIGDDARDPKRAFTRIVFVDAVDPKPSPLPFPAELTVSYEIAATLRDGAAAPAPAQVSVLLPVTTPPAQVPHLVSAGIALSPHEAADDYSATNQRERLLWLEFDAPPADPGDAYFVRVLANAPDPLLLHPDDVSPELAAEPTLPMDSEWMRLVNPGQPRDDDGLRAMQSLLRRSVEGASYLIPLPEVLTPASPELFGMFTYEVRVGHIGDRWSTAQARFGPPLRIAGIQHPPPPLVCQAARVETAVLIRANFASPVRSGRNVRPPTPQTRLWAMLYARIKQVDGAAWRNLLLLRVPLPPLVGDGLFAQLPSTLPALLYGESRIPIDVVRRELLRRGLPEDTPLTTLAVEFLVEPEIDEPLGKNLGHARMLRVSPLISIPSAC